MGDARMFDVEPRAVPVLGGLAEPGRPIADRAARPVADEGEKAFHGFRLIATIAFGVVLSLAFWAGFVDVLWRLMFWAGLVGVPWGLF